MFIDWLEPTTRAIEAAISAVEGSLRRDHPDRPNRTEYQYPREEYLAICLFQSAQALRSVPLCCRLIRDHLDHPDCALLQIDLATLCHEQQMWHRKLSEILCNIVNLDQFGDEYFKLFLLRDKAKGRRKLSRELQKIFGSETRLLEIYCVNDETAYDKARQILGRPGVDDWNAETHIGKAAAHLTDAERFVLGHYLDYRLRSGSIHFSTFPREDSQRDVNILLLHLTITVLFSHFISVRCARMYPIILPEVVALSEPELNRVFAEMFRNRFDPAIAVGDIVEVQVGTNFHRGTVQEVRTGSLGGLSFRVAALSNSGECWPGDFYPAMFVRKCENFTADT